MALINSRDTNGHLRLLTAQGNVYPGSTSLASLAYFGAAFVDAGLGPDTLGNSALRSALEAITDQPVPNANFDDATLAFFDTHINLFTPREVVRLAKILKLDIHDDLDIHEDSES
jgi:hypothetical protein